MKRKLIGILLVVLIAFGIFIVITPGDETNEKQKVHAEEYNQLTIKPMAYEKWAKIMSNRGYPTRLCDYSGSVQCDDE